jgi:hypothetical protein
MSSTEARRTVWILGAGFSKPLGGPLLADLLSPATTARVRTLYRTNKYLGTETTETEGKEERDEGVPAVRTLFALHGPTGEPANRLWDDAEVFLDQLDAAALAGGEASEWLTDLIFDAGNSRPTLNVLRTAARRLVAAACCVFLTSTKTDEERWQPYVSWAQEIGPSDTIVTFNYDRVLEMLDGQFRIADPGDPEGGPRDLPKVFKLHGSVDWRRFREPKEAPYVYFPTRRKEWALTCPGDEIGIATPGPTKKLHAEELGALWTSALRRLELAEVVVFLGYRFPQTDAEAREKLLRALRENTRPHLRLHIVLGPDKGHASVVRLQELLEHALEMAGRSKIPTHPTSLGHGTKTFCVITHALYAEDFFTVWDRNLLWPPNHSVIEPAGIVIEPGH